MNFLLIKFKPRNIKRGLSKGYMPLILYIIHHSTCTLLVLYIFQMEQTFLLMILWIYCCET